MKTTPPRLNRCVLTTFTAVLTLLSLTGGAALAANWTITDLSALGAGYGSPYESRAYSINNAGQVAGKGVVLTNGLLANHYVVWSNGTQIDLGIRIISSVVDAAPINDAGQVAGVIGEEDYRPFLWQAGVVTRLPSLPDTRITRIYGINAGGTVVGYNRIPWGGGLAYQSVFWQGGTVTDLRLPYGHIVTAINDSDALAIFINYSHRRSYVLSGSSTNVVEWPGLPVDDGTGALDLNNAGQVCGWAGGRAFLWPGVADALLPEFPYGGSSAVALNNLGHAVGYAYRGPSDNPAVLWRDGILTCLNDLPEVLSSGWGSLVARDINDHGQIVGFGNHDGVVRAFLLSPVTVPPPVSLTIMRRGNNVMVSFPTETGLGYQIQSATNLSATHWFNEGSRFPGTGGVLATNLPTGEELVKLFRLQIGN